MRHNLHWTEQVPLPFELMMTFPERMGSSWRHEAGKQACPHCSGVHDALRADLWEGCLKWNNEREHMCSDGVIYLPRTSEPASRARRRPVITTVDDERIKS